jgi:MFS family permease
VSEAPFDEHLSPDEGDQGGAEAPSAKGIRARWRRTVYARLLARPDFSLLWAGQVVSNLGTYTYALAVATLLTNRTSGPSLAHNVAIVLTLQAGSAAVVGLLFAGPVADRFDRRRVLILADVVRCIAVASLLLGAPSVVHLGLVAMLLGSFGALFDPCMAASLPNVVEERDIVPANAVVGGTFYAGVMLGPALGALIVAVVGVGAAFFVNAASFSVSAGLIAATHLGQAGRPEHQRITPALLARDLAEGARHLSRSRLAVAIMVVMCAVVAVAGAQATLQIVFVRQVLVPGAGEHAGRAAALAALTTAWGGGMLLGSFASPAIIRLIPRERLIPVAVAAAGVCVFVGSHATSVWSAGALWVIAGLMCGATNVSYETLVQERTADAYRGRLIATIEAAQEGAYFIGVAVAGWVAATASTGLQGVGIAFAVIGVAALFIIPSEAADRAEEASPQADVAQESRASSPPRPYVPGFGSWPEWASLSTPWEVSRDGGVVTIDLRWPLVASDWDRLVDRLDSVHEAGVIAIVMPAELPRGSLLPRTALEDLWKEMVERGMLVRRVEPKHVPVPAGAADRSVPGSSPGTPRADTSKGRSL